MKDSLKCLEQPSNRERRKERREKPLRGEDLLQRGKASPGSGGVNAGDMPKVQNDIARALRPQRTLSCGRQKRKRERSKYKQG